MPDNTVHHLLFPASAWEYCTASRALRNIYTIDINSETHKSFNRWVDSTRGIGRIPIILPKELHQIFKHLKDDLLGFYKSPGEDVDVGYEAETVKPKRNRSTLIKMLKELPLNQRIFKLTRAISKTIDGCHNPNVQDDLDQTRACLLREAKYLSIVTLADILKEEGAILHGYGPAHKKRRTVSLSPRKFQRGTQAAKRSNRRSRSRNR